MSARFATAADLVTESASEADFKLGLEAIGSGTGELVADPNTTYEGEGTQFKAGDLLFGKLRPYLAKAWLADRTGAAVGDFLVLRPKASFLGRYLRYVVLSEPFLGPINASVFGAKMPRTDWQTVRNVRIYLPSLDEQRRIADFLDAETAQIDALIAEQEHFIALLRERRRSVVDHVLLDHGVDLSDLEAPMVPTGWKVVLLSQVLRELTNGYVGPTRDILVEDGVRYIQGMHIKAGRIDFKRRPFFVRRDWHAARPRIHLREGDVLIVQTGDIGNVAVVPSDFGEASCHALLIARARLGTITGEYLGAYLSSCYGYGQLIKRATGALHPHLERGIRSTPVVVPPFLTTQAGVVAAVVDQNEKIDSMIGEMARNIALSKERRAALITAAVTGQIDVSTGSAA